LRVLLTALLVSLLLILVLLLLLVGTAALATLLILASALAALLATLLAALTLLLLVLVICHGEYSYVDGMPTSPKRFKFPKPWGFLAGTPVLSARDSSRHRNEKVKPEDNAEMGEHRGPPI
jgi:hypothetical protein